MESSFSARLKDSLSQEFTIERELGGGGMSRVFVAEEKKLGRRVVVKVLNPELAAGLSTERFQREIRLAAQLSDPRVVPLLSAGETLGLPWYTMPFVEGDSLRALLARGPVPLTMVVGVLRDIALALEYAHGHGVVHRDIKPENVLLTRRTAVVTDFGIAKALGAAAKQAGDEALTTIGGVIGTPAYMSPEQAAGGTVDHRADLYAWGLIAWELLAGAHPFKSSPNPQAMLAAHITQKPPRLVDRVGGIPTGLVQLVERTLAKDPELRPRDATELLQLLDRTSPAGETIPVRGGRRIATIGVVAGVLLLLAGLLFTRNRHPTASTDAAPRSLAVLPFENVGGDTANSYFAAGMADELITAFTRVPGLRVVSRGSAFQFHGGEVPVRDVARQLNVESVLEGSVRREGDRIRVSARLTNASDGTVLWADRYDRQLAEVFDVQDQITRAIVAALRGTLGGGEGGAAPRGTADLGAYDLYLKGRYYWGLRGDGGLRTAIDYFERAVQSDSSFARGFAGLSMAQVVLPIFASVSADSMLALAIASADRALAIDPTLAEAHLAIAYARKMQWRWSESEQHFRDALALAPNDAGVHHWYGVLLYAVGRIPESVAELLRARALDPLAGTIGSDLAIALYAGRRYDEALAAVQIDLSTDTTKSDASFVLGQIELARGRPDNALAAFERGMRMGSGFDLSGYLSVVYRALGRTREADSIYVGLLDRYRRDPTLGWVVAIAAVGAGDRDRALAAVAQTIERRPMLLTEMSLPCDPLFDPLKANPRFGQLLDAAGMRMCPASPPSR